MFLELSGSRLGFVRGSASIPGTLNQSFVN